ncbi:MAG: HU family DNA-binding protein [Paludibacteraceae bacterium]
MKIIKTMLTKELIAKIAASSGLSKTLTEDMIGAFTAEMRNALMADKSISIQGLGVFEVKERSERVNVHPKTGERQVIPARQQVIFKPASILKEVFN